jgi:large subunit ribosomal protein L23
MQADSILEETIISEKATALSSSVNQYTFRIHSSANRISVAQAVESSFGVKVTGVNILNVKRKAKRDRTRRGQFGYKGGFKKAIVSLKEGDQIELI